MKKITNLFILILSFGLGQVLFLYTQTQLIAAGRIAVVGEMGLLISLIVILMWLVDFGGGLLINKFLGNKDLWLNKTICLFHIRVFCVLVVVLFLIFSSFLNINKFSFNYISLVFLILGLNSFNLWGGFDYYGVSYLPALSQTAPYILLSFFMLQNGPWSNAAPSHIILFSFAISGLIFILIQFLYVFLNSKLKHLSLVYKNILKIQTIELYKAVLFDGGSYVLNFLLSQIYGRGMIVLIATTLGNSSGGVFNYVKTLANIYSQCISICRRIELKEFGHNMVIIKNGYFDYSEVAKKSKLSHLFSLVSLGLFFLFLFSFKYYGFEEFSRFYDVFDFFSLYVICLTLWFISSSIFQYCFVKYGFSISFKINALTTPVSFILAFLLINHIGLYSVIVSEFFLYSMQLIFIVVWLRNKYV